MNKIKILIVEDDSDSVFLLKKILLKKEYEISDVADNGNDAISKAIKLHPNIVLMDVNIQGDIDGVETAKIIKAETDVPVIFLTGSNDNKTIARAKETNPSGYILKPYTEKEVNISIEMALYKHKIDQQLKEKEHRQSVTLSTLSEGVVTTDANGVITYINPTAEVITGIIKEKALGQRAAHVINICYRHTNRAVADMEGFLFKNTHPAHGKQPFIIQALNSENRYVEIDTSPSIDSTGNIFSYVITIRDITNTYKSEEAMSMMAASLESINDGVLVTESEFGDTYPNIVYTNKGLELMSLYKKEELQGKPLDFLFGDNLPRNWRQQLLNCVKENYPLSEEITIKRQDGSMHIVFLSISVVKDKQNEPHNIVFILRDISKLRRLEENVRKAQKIEGIGRLAGGIAHDFNNLLSVINSYSDLLRIKLGDDSPYIKYVDNIRASGKKGADLVSQLMTFSRREAHSPKVIQLKEVIQETEQMLHRVIKENIHLCTHLDNEVYPIKADFGQMEQILMNLCVNARDAMPNGGRLDIYLENKNILLNDEQRKINPKLPGNYVCLTVKDTGTGMNEETKKHVYEPFYTTKDVGEGTGLGLSTVYGIVKQSGGYIDLESETGKGTQFSIYFPAILDEEASDAPQVEAVSSRVPRGNEKVLVIEDDPTFADCISGILSLHGYIVHTASEGQSALDAFENKANEVKLLITDLILPKLSGREVASRLMERNPNLKVIFMTGYDDQIDSFYEVPEKSIFLQKPFSLNTILNKTRELLDKKELAEDEILKSD